MVELAGRLHPFRPGIDADGISQIGGHRTNTAIDLLLLLTPAPRQLEIAEEQEEDEPDRWDEEHSQKPGHGGSGTPVAGNDAQQHNAHNDFRNGPCTQ
ncbi:hypothetical protein D9M72_624590 [compost metagenome]